MSSKIKLILGSFLAFSLILGTLILFNFRRLEGDTSWLDHTHGTIHRLQKTYSDLKEVQANYLSYLLTRRPRFHDACRRGLESLRENLARTERTPPEEPLIGKEMGRWELLFGQKIDSIQDGLNQVDSGHADRALAELQEREEKARDQEIKSLTDRMIGTQIWFLKTRKAFEEIDNRKDLTYLIGGGLGALVLFGLAFFLIDRQIREKQKLLDSLRSNEEKFRLLAESANDAFLITDENGLIIDVNTGVEHLLGHTPDELIGRPLGRVLSTSGEDPEAPFPEFLSRTQGARTLELIGRHKNGTQVQLEGSISRWTPQAGVFYAVVLRDITDRKFFIKTLLANEHRLFQFLDVIPVAVLVREPNGALYFFNQKAKELFDLPPATLPASIRFPVLIRDLYPSRTSEPVPESDLPSSRALQGERTHRDDLELRREGRTTSLEIWGAPILDEKGMVKFGLSAIMDVTRQKKATESLREREEFFRNLFEEGPIGMMLSLHNGTIVNTNRAFADMLGIPKRELLGRSFYDHTVMGDKPPERALDEKLFDRTLPKYQLEKRFVTQKGDILRCKVSVSAIRDPNDQPLFRLSIIENVTEQKEAETALKESEERFRAVNDSSNDPIVSADSMGRIIYFNPAAVQLFGFSRKDALGMTLTALLAPDSLKDHEEAFRRAFAGGTSPLVGKTTEWTARDQKGREFPVDLSLFTWFTEAGIFVTAMFRDITDRKQLEEMKDDLISVVSHQLKTPVAQINGFIENMLEGLAGDITPVQREYLTEMRGIGEENYRLISDLLSLSKIERGVLQAELGPESLREIVELTARDYADFIREKGLDFISSGPDLEIRVLVDKYKTVEALRNILNNAFKCTDHGSITLTWSSNGGDAVVEIQDTGIGMDEATLKGLFRKSRVLGPEAGRSGAGLGLYIAKSFLDMQNGAISVVSECGKGTTFRIKLPLADP